MIYVGLSDRALRKLFIHNDIQIFDKVVHPCKAKEYANMLNNSKKDYILYRYNNKKSAIRNFGHFIVQSWVVLTTQNKLKITIRSHFDLIKCDLRRGREC